uniref:Small EDRK-rich factor 2b n=1 Tax=Dicentrarchus labrax TaxID=13489 RepID=A0A8P4K1B3_DICLA
MRMRSAINGETECSGSRLTEVSRIFGSHRGATKSINSDWSDERGTDGPLAELIWILRKEASINKMTRGNQRELARQKNAKKNNDQGKGKRGDDGLSAAARKQRDAEIMQQKQKKAPRPSKERRRR